MQVQKGTAIHKFVANDSESAEPGTSPQGPRPFVTASIDGVEAHGDLYLTIAGQFAAAARGRPEVRRCRRCRPYFFEFSCRVASEAPLELTGAAARRRAGVGAYKFLRPKKNNFGPHRGWVHRVDSGAFRRPQKDHVGRGTASLSRPCDASPSALHARTSSSRANRCFAFDTQTCF